MAGLLLTMVQAGSALVLDAGVQPPTCAPSTGEVVVCARSDRLSTILPMRVGDAPGTVLVEPSGPRYLSCNPEFILAAGITGEGPVRIGNVGPVEVEGGTTQLRVAILDQSFPRTIRWSGYRPVRGADCVIGPRGLRYRTIRFLIGRDRPDAVDTVLRFDRYDSGRVYVTVPVGRARLSTRIELAHAGSVITAPGARLIAPMLGGSVVGEARSENIIDGVFRPTRELRLREPLRIGPIALATLSVRVSDYGRADQLRTLAPDELDPADIVVPAKQETPGSVRLLRLGRDALSGCVSITLDMRERRMMLRC